MIVNRSQPNNFKEKYGWSQNWMYFLQRLSGVVLFFFLIVHVITTTGAKYYTGTSASILYDAWHAKLANPLWLLLYMAGVLAASYHLAYGVWNFCIRWGITISERAQLRVQKFALWLFILVTLLGWGALGGFMVRRGNVQSVETPPVQTLGPSTTSGATGV
jgi:succinate dehydrogenase / fumarate reductase cytochrome b subunit